MKHTKLADTLKTAAVLALTTAIGFLLEAMGLSQTNVITVYIPVSYTHLIHPATGRQAAAS